MSNDLTSSTPPPVYPCNCCGGESCTCHVIDSSDPNGYVVGSAYGNGFAGNSAGFCYYWVHRAYPVPITSATWNSKLGIVLGPNAVISTEDPHSPECPGVLYYGDWHFYTRSGTGGIANSIGTIVEHWDGDGSNRPYPMTYTEFQLKTEVDKEAKVCKLYSRARTRQDEAVVPDYPEEWQLIDTAPFSKKGKLGNRVVNLPYTFGGKASVELIFRCGYGPVQSPCIATTAGNASYVNGPILCGEQICDSNHGSYVGNSDLTYVNIPQGFEQICVSIKTKNICTYFSASLRTGIDFFRRWFPDRYIGYGADCEAYYFATGSIDGLDPKSCFGKVYSINTNPDGTTFEGNIGVSPGCAFYNDPFVLNVTSRDSITYAGIWTNIPKNINFVRNCEKVYTCEFVVSDDPPEEYAIGTVTVSRL